MADRIDKGECIPAGEDELFAQILELTARFQTLQNPATVSVSQRDFHPKQHACLAAQWLPYAQIPDNIRHGVFAVRTPIQAVLRYSNGSPKDPRGSGMVPPDAKPDARGLGIKLVGVPGESILDVEGERSGVMNQDFVLINDPAFFLSTPKSYPDFVSFISQGKPFFQILSPLELKVLQRTTRPVADVATQQFHSQTPYRLGDEIVKYRTRPCKEEVVSAVSEKESSDPDFLRKRLVKRLKAKDICLIFSVQVRKPNMDVEDAAVDWLETESPFVDVAKIVTFKGQSLEGRDSYCENASFNPWNALPENRPVGAINRARLTVYTGISRKRRMENQAPVREPEVTDDFFRKLR